MFISHKLSTTYGRTLVSEPRRLVIPEDPTGALEFAATIDTQADRCLCEGQFAAAERLSHLALEARCRATGERA